MKLVDNVREYLDKRAKDLSLKFYEDTLDQLSFESDTSGENIESPVEQLFYIEWNLRDWNRNTRIPFDLEFQYKDKSTGKYRIDFIIEFAIDAYNLFVDRHFTAKEFKKVEYPKLAIEIDSHIWHEKTKEQAQYHKERERFLVSNGWKLLRYTGSEVYKNPEKCVDEALKIAYQIRNKYHDKLRELYK